MESVEHEFDPTPMNERRCWKCGLELPNPVHDFTSASDKTMEEYMAHENEYFFQKGFTEGYKTGDANARVELEPKSTFGGVGFIVDEVVGNTPVFFNPSAFYIDDDNRLWAKPETNIGDELIIRVSGEPPAGQYGFAPNQQNPDGPCSCLAHRVENCSECFSGLMNKVSPNPSFGFGDVGPSDLPRVPSVPKAYIAYPAGMNPKTPLHGHEFESDINANFSETDGRTNIVLTNNVALRAAHQVVKENYRLSSDDVPKIAEAIRKHVGPELHDLATQLMDCEEDDSEKQNNVDNEIVEVGRVTVDDMMDSIRYITETIYPNQSGSLLPKFETVIRVMFEQAIDAVNIG